MEGIKSGTSLGIFRGTYNRTSGTFNDIDYIDYLARMVVQPTAARALLLYNLIVGIKADLEIQRLYQRFDVFYLLASHNQQASRLNLVRNRHDITEFNSPTWILDRGYTGNGSTMYLNTNYNASADGLRYHTDDASYGLHFGTTGSSNSADFGANGVGNTPLISMTIRDSPGNTLYRINDSGAQIKPHIGKASSVRRGLAGNIQLFQDGIGAGLVAQPSTGIPNFQNYIFCRNNAGTAAFFSPHQIQIVWMGGGNIDHLKVHNRIRTYLTAIGAP